VHRRPHLCRASQQSWDHMAGWFVIAGFIFLGLLVLQVEQRALASMSRPEIERVKAFITRKVDRFRPSYGRRVIEVPRQSVFIGSTNSDAYLKDETAFLADPLWRQH
jgi:hypothetical protein